MTTQVMSTAAMSRLACCRAFTFIQLSRAVQARQARGAAPRTLTSTCGAHGGDQAQASSTAADQGQPKPSLAKDPGTEAYGQVGTGSRPPPGRSAAPAARPSGTPPPSLRVAQVTAAQANFVRVRIDRLAGDGGGMPPRARLLCVVRGLLKKMKQHVLVGDRVKVVGVDWTDGRGERSCACLHAGGRASEGAPSDGRARSLANTPWRLAPLRCQPSSARSPSAGLSVDFALGF
jgi:hypothetical protein